MRIKKITLNSYRSYEHIVFTPEGGLNLLCGANAVGKTNVLEAVFYCALGRSHRTSRDAELIAHGAVGAYIGLELETNSGLRTIEIKLKSGERKQLFIDRQKVERSADLMGVLNVVMFSPEDLALVKASPAERRRFMDMELCQLRPAYYACAARYNAALRQRNVLIKEAFTNRIDSDMLDMWNSQLAKLGADIMRSRRYFMDELSTLARDTHLKLTDGQEQLCVSYEPNIKFSENGDEYAIYEALGASRDEDIRRGFTLRGPHRDDIGIRLDGREVKVYGSQGQQRTAALSLKLSELALMYSITGEKPVLLLDDVLSELDSCRQSALMSSAFECQCLLTTTGLSRANFSGMDCAAFEVKAGNIIKMR